MANNDLFKGFLVGAAVVALAPLLVTALSGRQGGSLGRGFARAGGVLANKARETAAELAEVAEDTAAELQAPETVHETDVAAAAPAEGAAGPDTASGGVS
jgi:gas vesicle protein